MYLKRHHDVSMLSGLAQLLRHYNSHRPHQGLS